MELIVKQGYKQTEVGLIPEDWQVLPIGESLIFKNGLNKASEFFGYGTPILNYMDVFKHHGIHQSDIKGKVFITTQEKKNFSAKKGDVFFTRTSETQEEIGISAVLLDEIEDCVFSGFVLRGRPKNQIISPFYYQYCLEPNYVRNQIIGKSSYTTRALTNGRYLSQVNIVIPPTLTEQKAIATALSDVDELISSLEKLITKKKAIKKGAMQELLTGKTRLKDFEGNGNFKQTEIGIIPEDWKVLPMSDLTTMMTNGFVGTAKTHYTDSRNGVTYIQGFNVKANSFNFTGIKRVTLEFHKKNDKSKLRVGDLLTVQTGDVGLTTIVPKELEGSNCHALIISRFDFKKAYPWFYAQYFNSVAGRGRLVELETGTTMKHINVGELIHWQVPFPPTLSEQKAIADTLSDMDKEISQLEAKKEKYQAIKQGMMQELLTGKTRLV